jgi:ubiquinone/menaquinone biosynthesis C-methylase UbiE
MPATDSKQFEKEYLRRSGGGEWEASKPFPPPGQFATDDHSQHLLDFAVLLRVLAPGPADLTLDLGAGSCWVSDWLRRFGLKTVAIDISVDMLRLGAARLGGARALTAGDMEALPFAAGAFSKACCLNAFHHVPNMAGALREIRRVLAPDGVAFFSEPGTGHANRPTSVAATRNYGVLEQEILVDDFMQACLDAGFADVRLHPISHIVPLFEVNRDQWRAWRKFTASIRPFRALEKLRRAALEIAGLRKADLLWEEAFAIRLARELKPIIEQHPVITAHCTPFVKPVNAPVDAAVLEVPAPPTLAKAGAPVVVRVRLQNAGTTRWETAPDRGEVRLGVQLLAGDGSVINRDYARHALAAPIEPGGRCELTMRIAAPSQVGTYYFKLDMVREGVTWFELAGSPTVSLPLSVTE